MRCPVVAISLNPQIMMCSRLSRNTAELLASDKATLINFKRIKRRTLQVYLALNTIKVPRLLCSIWIQTSRAGAMSLRATIIIRYPSQPRQPTAISLWTQQIGRASRPLTPRKMITYQTQWCSSTRTTLSSWSNGQISPSCCRTPPTLNVSVLKVVVITPS